MYKDVSKLHDDESRMCIKHKGSCVPRQLLVNVRTGMLIAVAEELPTTRDEDTLSVFCAGFSCKQLDWCFRTVASLYYISSQACSGSVLRFAGRSAG